MSQEFDNFHTYKITDNFVCALAILRYLLRRPATMGGAGCNFSGGIKMGQEGFYREWCLKGRWPAAAVSTFSSSNLNSTTCYFKAGDTFLLLRFARHYRRWPGRSIFSYAIWHSNPRFRQEKHGTSRSYSRGRCHRSSAPNPIRYDV